MAFLNYFFDACNGAVAGVIGSAVAAGVLLKYFGPSLLQLIFPG